MLLSPLRSVSLRVTPFGYGIIKTNHITQNFGKNPRIYKRWGMNGHNGTDFRAKVGTAVYSPISGTVIESRNDGIGYGNFVRIQNEKYQVLLGHLMVRHLQTGDFVNMGDLVGVSGYTGFCIPSGPAGAHLHLGVRRVDKNKVLHYNNGFKGYINIEKYILSWYDNILHNL
jgi:murein DD-endopeptidase MepM/ murein hydrolase activator NlpD